MQRRRLDREGARRGGGEERADPGLKAGGYRAVAICLLNAYANPVHEKRLAAADHRGAARRAGDVQPSGGARVPRVRARLDDLAVGLRAAGDRRLPASLREQARRLRLQGPLHGDAVQRRPPAGRGDARERHHRALFRPGRRRGRRHPPGRALGLRRPHHLRHGRHLDRRLPGAGRPARRSPRKARSTACRSARRCSTSSRSAPAAARSPGSTTAACCASARKAPAPIPAPPATARAAPSPPRPTRTSSSARSGPARSSAAA